MAWWCLGGVFGLLILYKAFGLLVVSSGGVVSYIGNLYRRIGLYALQDV